MKFTSILLLFFSSHQAKRTILNKIRNLDELVPIKERFAHPKVNKASCSTAIDRLKKGPANIPEVIKQEKEYVDQDFSGTATLYLGSEFNSESWISTYNN